MAHCTAANALLWILSNDSLNTHVFSILGSSFDGCSIGFKGIRRKFGLDNKSLACVTSSFMMSTLTSSFFALGLVVAAFESFNELSMFGD